MLSLATGEETLPGGKGSGIEGGFARSRGVFEGGSSSEGARRGGSKKWS